MLFAQTFEECLGFVEAGSDASRYANGRARRSTKTGTNTGADTSADNGASPKGANSWTVTSIEPGAGPGADPGTGLHTRSGAGAETDTGTVPVPVPEPLAGLLPGGLRRGEVAALATRNRDQHADYLALALLAEALNVGLWCAVVGVPELGFAALAGMLGPAGSAVSAERSGPVGARAPLRQAALDHLVVVPEPGERWAEVLAVLADGVDLLLVRPATPVSTLIADRVDARLRPNRSPDATAVDEMTHGAALLVLGGWPSARLSLRITRADWTGLDGIGPTAGTGRLTGCRATVVAQGRSTAGRPRAARLWLPDANGSVRALSDVPRTTVPRSTATRPPSTTG
ncbi:MAG TPA: hypothetical protein VGS97_15840 [Actinocrinis sp.]|uniref:hypothetical protein n=1 Tax=Actinocrinis sp. TaxID=1920516 RepID=UPI002DDD15C7|nr:hypothetical protein [Actinocrinis sp.]HEV2345570.1 hypothetical protein [Actinocrinis sp.]